jgi:hypothetical protein
MAITVKLNDMTVTVGGDFQSALAFVKSFNGRRFDAATKTWIVPTTSKEFRQGCTLPLDLGTGEHITSWGTRYSGSEWDAKHERDNITVPAGIVAQVAAAERAAEQALIDTLRALGMNDATIAKLRGIHNRFHGDLDLAVEMGKIVFSSAARRQAIENAFEAWETAYLKAQDAADDYIAAEERRIDEKYGVY